MSDLVGKLEDRFSHDAAQLAKGSQNALSTVSHTHSFALSTVSHTHNIIKHIFLLRSYLYIIVYVFSFVAVSIAPDRVHIQSSNSI